MKTKKGPRARKLENTKAATIVRYKAEHPMATPQEIAASVGAHYTYVNCVLRKHRKAFTGGKRLVQSNGQEQGDLTKAVKQIKTLKQIGLERVRELLALLEAIHGK